jgi:hypothetical protein
MEDKELNEKWDEMLKKNFQLFIEENVGFKPLTKEPACYGTGNGKSYCKACDLKNNC